jgi:hypothetical protein
MNVKIESVMNVDKTIDPLILLPLIHQQVVERLGKALGISIDQIFLPAFFHQIHNANDNR